MIGIRSLSEIEGKIMCERESENTPSHPFLGVGDQEDYVRKYVEGQGGHTRARILPDRARSRLNQYMTQNLEP